MLTEGAVADASTLDVLPGATGSLRAPVHAGQASGQGLFRVVSSEGGATDFLSVGHRFESGTARPVEDGMKAGYTTIAALAAVVLSGLVYVNCPQIRALCAEGKALDLAVCAASTI